MLMQGQVLSPEERRIIHADSLRILEEVGIRFPVEKALGLLESAGARIDWDTQVAFIPAALVEEALAAAPKKFVLGARNPAYDLAFPSLVSTWNLDGCGVHMLDFATGSKRSAVLQDVADSARVFETVDLGTILWPPVSPCDVPRAARSIASTGTAFCNTSKHVQDEVKDIREVRYIMEMAAAILGGRDEAVRRKIYSVTYCTVAPLAHDEAMLEATMELAQYDAPILVYPMPACGSTGPASLYSNVALANAEALSSIVLFQLVKPGIPLLYGAALGAINLRNGIFLEGAPETALQLCAMGEMGKNYGFPTMIAGCLTDAKEPGMQAVLEKLLTMLPLVQSGVDVVQGLGLIESSMTLSLEHILIDAEIGRLCKRLRDGIDVRPEKNYFEDIRTVGQEGHFLKQKSTRAALRTSEFFTPDFCERGSYEEWTALGSPTMLTRAHQQVQAILKADMPHPLSASCEAVIREIVEEAKAVLD